MNVFKLCASPMRETVFRLYKQGAFNGHIESTLTHWMRFVKAGLGDWIKPSLQALTTTIHRLLQQIEKAKAQRRLVAMLADLV